MSQALGFASPSPQTVTRESFPGYVLTEILRTSGPQVPRGHADGILTAFWDRFGPDKSLLLCAAVFGLHGGFWRGAPVTPLRFDAAQDEFFALPLLAGGGAG